MSLILIWLPNHVGHFLRECSGLKSSFERSKQSDGCRCHQGFGVKTLFWHVGIYSYLTGSSDLSTAFLSDLRFPERLEFVSRHNKMKSRCHLCPCRSHTINKSVSMALHTPSMPSTSLFGMECACLSEGSSWAPSLACVLRFLNEIDGFRRRLIWPTCALPSSTLPAVHLILFLFTIYWPPRISRRVVRPANGGV